MAQFWTSCALAAIIMSFSGGVHGESVFAGSSVSSDSSGTRSVLVTGKNGGVGGVQTRLGSGGSSGVNVGTSSGSTGVYTRSGGVGTYAGPAGSYAGPGGAYAGSGGAFAGPGGAYAGPGGAYAGAGGAFASAGTPYYGGGGSYASSSAGGGYYPHPYDPYYGDGYGNGAGVFTSSDSNGISTRFASVGPGGQATIVEQNGDEAPRVYTYRGAGSASEHTDFKN